MTQCVEGRGTRHSQESFEPRFFPLEHPPTAPLRPQDQKRVNMAIPVPAPRVARFERLGYDMFIHWGLYAQLGQGEWVQHLRKIPMQEYVQLKQSCTAADFALKSEGKLYLFIHHLSVGGDAHVTVGAGGAGPRAFRGLDRSVTGVRWIDNEEELTFTHANGLLCVDATGYPYGVDRIVRVAEVDVE